MNKGRSPRNQPATAYDRQRYIALVQVIATSRNDDGIRALCREWDVQPIRNAYGINILATFIALAQHVIEYHKDDES